MQKKKNQKTEKQILSQLVPFNIFLKVALAYVKSIIERFNKG